MGFSIICIFVEERKLHTNLTIKLYITFVNAIITP
jgi:hypothetical protein